MEELALKMEMILLVEIMLIQLILHQIPQLFEESQNLDFLIFADAADIWGVDYDSSIKGNGLESLLVLLLIG